MKIVTYSDLHLEFGADFTPPATDADVMILAGDICVLKDYDPLDRLLARWQKPVLYVTGNHEYYTRSSMTAEDAAFRSWLAKTHPYVHLLQDEAVTIDGVHFFGGTMWTSFSGGDRRAMDFAERNMNDFRLIQKENGDYFTAADSIALHDIFVEKLTEWFEAPLIGPRVVITHHAPVINPHTKYRGSDLSPAFNSLDMVPVIEKYQPALWVYGHTHECDRQTLGKTQIISNQRGYPNRYEGGFECSDFDEAGAPFIVTDKPA